MYCNTTETSRRFVEHVYLLPNLKKTLNDHAGTDRKRGVLKKMCDLRVNMNRNNEQKIAKTPLQISGSTIALVLF